MRKLVAVALAFTVAAQGLMPPPVQANPLAGITLGVLLRGAAKFLAEYAAGKFLDEVLFDRKERERLDKRLQEMRAEYRAFQGNFAGLQDMIRENNGALAELRHHLRLLEAQAQLEGALQEEAAKTLRQLNQRLSTRDRRLDDFLAALPSRIDKVIATRDKAAASALAGEIYQALPLIEARQPPGEFLQELLAFSTKVVDRIERLEVDVEDVEGSIKEHGEQIQALTGRVDQQRDSVQNLKAEVERERIQRAKDVNLLLTEINRIESRLRTYMHYHLSSLPVEVVEIRKDYSSLEGIIFLLEIEGALQRHCGSLPVITSPALPGEPVQVRCALAYTVQCYPDAIGCLACNWGITMQGLRTQHSLTHEGESCVNDLNTTRAVFRDRLDKFMKERSACDMLR